MPNARNEDLQEAISNHLQVHGPCKWDLVRNEFPDISRATFWRYVKTVRSEQTAVDEKPEPGPAWEMPTGSTEPAQVLKNRFLAPSFNAEQLFAEYDRLMREAKEMGRQAKNGQGKITNWKMLQKSIELVRSLLVDQSNAARELMDTEKMQQFYTAMIDTLVETSPEVAKDIMLRLQGLKEGQQL